MEEDEDCPELVPIIDLVPDEQTQCKIPVTIITGYLGECTLGSSQGHNYNT